MTGDPPGAGDGTADDAPPRGAQWAVRTFARPAAVGVVLGVVTDVVLLRTQDAVVVGVVTTLALVLASTLASGDEYLWPEPAPEATDGSRRDVTLLSWTLVGRDGRVTEAAVRRVRENAERRLARRGVRLAGGLTAAGSGVNEADAEAAARALLGDRAWTALTGRGGWLPSLGDLQHCVDVVERLGDPPRPPATPSSPPLAPAPPPDGRTTP